MSSFDDRAATWDDDSKRARAQDVGDAVRQAVPLHRSMRLLEYGAGTGLVTQALRDEVGPVTLADSSAGMRAVMQEKIDSGALPDARVWAIDLSVDAAPDEQFDVIVTSMTLHHIPDLPPVLEKFANLLDPAGRLCIIDLEKEDGSFHRATAMVHGEHFGGHNGFDRDDLRDQLAGAGFVDITFTHCTDVTRDDGSVYPLFLATARRP